MATTQFKLLDVVALTEDLPENPLVRGQVGTIVENLAADVYEVEFSDDDGQTYAMLPLHTSQLMPLHYLPINLETPADKPATNTQPTAMNQIHQYGQGDNVAGDKVMGDKVAGNKTVTNFTQNNSGGTNFQTQISGGTVNQAETINIDNSHTQVLQLVANLRQLASSFPQEVQDDLIIDIDDVEEELKKPEGDRNPKKLKKRLLALAAATTLVATPVAGMTDFTNNVLDIGEKLGIELPSPLN